MRGFGQTSVGRACSSTSGKVLSSVPRGFPKFPFRWNTSPTHPPNRLNPSCISADAGGAVGCPARSRVALEGLRPPCRTQTTMAASVTLRYLSGMRFVPRCPRTELLWTPRRWHRLSPADDELYQRTRISLLRRELPHAMYIDSYSSRGFTVNGNRVLGPCALLPHSVLQWNVGSHQDITEESFSLFWMLEPRIAQCLCHLQLPVS
ncbi:NADH dehydrogenase [ubiquinone] 1 alpha subcomplex assembly factor 3 isoform X2 [Cavia porcellus]|uniref:NADH dehydrogenase [ubiquinone] 1 alpha subcomplex assembly factor 3 isoform X2 n=1 Tax=Cavia porcellus TaxID=10141 RepID=UPI002FE29AC1